MMSTTQMCQFVALTNIHYFSSTTTYAGVAAAAGELAKDQKHQDVVEETGWGVILFLWW